MKRTLERMYICVYDGVILLYSADWHNLVSQLYFSFKKKEMSYQAMNRNGGNFNASYYTEEANLSRKKPV